MPTYDYRCEACSHEFSLFQSITADPCDTCPECGKKKVRRLIGTGAGIIFKGDGFYETDYKRKRNGNGGGTSTPGKKPGEKEPASDGASKSDSGAKKSDSGASSD